MTLRELLPTISLRGGIFMESINDLAIRTVEALQAYGFPEYTAWNDYGRIFRPIVKAHEARGLVEFDRETITDTNPQ
jgi:hypothetical protein